MSQRLSRSGARALVVLWAGVLGCSTESPDGDGSTFLSPPSPVRICVEIDQMIGTRPMPPTAHLRGQEVDVESLFPPPLDLVIVRDALNLAAVTPIARKDLFAWRREFGSMAFTECAARVWVLVAHAATDPRLEAQLFAEGTRQGVAIYSTNLPSDPLEADAELLRRLAHELLHVFNAHHEDYDDDRPPYGFHRAGTIESYAPLRDLRWALGERTLEHLLRHPRSLVLPNSGYPFGFVSAAHRDRHQILGERGTSHRLAEPSDPPLDPEVSALAGTADRNGSEGGGRGSGLRLRLVGPEVVELGTPISVRAILEGDALELDAPVLLDPGYGFASFEVRSPEGDVESFLPLGSKDRFGPPDPGTLAGPADGVLVSETVDLFFGSAGWTFPRPGRYQIRASYDFADGQHEPLAAEPIEVVVNEPPAERLAAIRRVIREEAGWSDPVGRFLLLRGGDVEGSRERLEAFVDEQFDAPQAAWFRMALVLDALQPTVDAERGVRPPPEVQRAERLLDGLLGPMAAEVLPVRDLLSAHLLLSGAIAARGDRERALQIRRRAIEVLRPEELRQLEADPTLLHEWDATESVLPITPTERRLLHDVGADRFAVPEERP